jgi:predicted RNA binding protein YcfA (HicA-like mRNA interferase family)
MDYYADVRTILRDLGYELHRSGKGSHEIWRNAATGVSVTVPRHLKSRYTANGILKRVGSDHKF